MAERRGRWRPAAVVLAAVVALVVGGPARACTVLGVACGEPSPTEPSPTEPPPTEPSPTEPPTSTSTSTSTTSSSTTSSTAPPSSTTTAPSRSSPADELLWRLNEERAERGLPPVRARDDVVAVAIDHSEAMDRAGRLHHNDAWFTDESRDRHGARTVGENVAYGPSMEAVHDELMASDGHRANLLDPRWRVVGIGVVEGGDRFWVTQDFLEPR